MTGNITQRQCSKAHSVASERKYGLQFRVRHNHTTVDAPETVYFVREEKRKFEQMGIPYEIHYPKESMWQLIVRHVTPPTRLMRYCCADLKENTGEFGERIVTGVRNAICLNPLYGCGNCRVGCIGCPMAGDKRWSEFER